MIVLANHHEGIDTLCCTVRHIVLAMTPFIVRAQRASDDTKSYLANENQRPAAVATSPEHTIIQRALDQRANSL